MSIEEAVRGDMTVAEQLPNWKALRKRITVLAEEREAIRRRHRDWK